MLQGMSGPSIARAAPDAALYALGRVQGARAQPSVSRLSGKSFSQALLGSDEGGMSEPENKRLSFT